jgi:hypothetical protein
VITVVAIDGGLATSGIVAVRTDGASHRCVCAEVFTSDPLARKLDIELADDRVRRTRLLSRWLEGHLTRWSPTVVAAEGMSFPRGAHAIAAICLAWGALCDQLELRELPLVTAGPREWRAHLVASAPTRRRNDTIGGASERDAHREAVRRVPTFEDASKGISRRRRVHALDALGVFAWSLSTNIVRAALGAGPSLHSEMEISATRPL